MYSFSQRAVWSTKSLQRLDTLLISTWLVSDIDECTDGSHDCSANGVCQNTDGGFTCQCNDGYTGDGETCAGNPRCCFFFKKLTFSYVKQANKWQGMTCKVSHHKYVTTALSESCRLNYGVTSMHMQFCYGMEYTRKCAYPAVLFSISCYEVTVYHGN